MNKKIILHIGSPKTATTTFQKYLFKNIKNIKYIEYDSLYNNCPSFRKIIYSDSMYLNSSLIESARSEVDQFHKKLKLYDYEYIFYSKEHLVHNILDTGKTAEKIHKIFGKIKIILTIRNQFDVITSNYKHLQRSYTSPWKSAMVSPKVDKFISNTMKHDGIRGSYSNLLTKFDYGFIVKAYEKFFDEKDIKVLLFEEYVNEREVFLKKLLNFLKSDLIDPSMEKRNVKLNESFSNGKIKFNFYVSLILPIFVQYLFKDIKMPSFFEKFLDKFSFRTELSKKSKNLIRSRFKEGNKYLYDKLNLNLKKYNYPM